jgi:hypothetical protein
LDTDAAPTEAGERQWAYALLDSQFRRCMRNAGYELILGRELDKAVQRKTLRVGGVETLPIAGD